MATYSTIKGFNIQSLATDPYATAAASGTWASGTAMSTTRQQGASAQIAPTTAAQVAGGGGPGSLTGNNEQYNGSAWTEVGNLQTAKFGPGGTGTQTAALSAGGYTTTWVAETETWNGSSWATGNNLSAAARFEMACAGTSTAGLIAGGEATPASTPVALCESYNGTSWTASNALNQARYGLVGGGTSTAALAIGGFIGGSATPSALTEEFDGTSWAETGDLNTARGIGGAAVTTTEDTIFFAGATHPGTALKAQTESFDGTTWTEVGDLGTARAYVNAAGSASAALCMGGGPGTAGGTATEEWTVASPLSVAQEGQVWYNTTSTVLKGYKKVFGTGAWASAPSLNTSRSQMGAAGSTNTAALVFGGTEPGASDKTEEYNGTTWTEKADLINARDNLVGLGTQTAALAVGGSPPANAGYTESWNGTSWTAKNALSRGSASPQASTYAMGSGSTTSALFYGGDEGGNIQALCESFDGTNWTEVADLNGGKSYAVGAGTSNASAITYGGYPSVLDETEIWNGSTWTEVANLNTARSRISGACQGTTTASLAFGGDSSPDHLTATESWDGTSWTTEASLATGVNDSGGAGVSTSAISAGGVNSPSPVGVVGVESWTVPAPNEIKTFTAS